MFMSQESSVFESPFLHADVNDMPIRLQMALEAYDEVLRIASLKPLGREAAKGVMYRAYEDAMQALGVDPEFTTTVYSMEAHGGLQMALEDDEEGILKRIWNAIVKAFKWFMDKIGLGSESAEKADESTDAKVEKAKKKLKDKFDGDGRLLHERQAVGFPQFGKGRIRPNKILEYIEKDLHGSHNRIVALANSLTDLVRDSKKFVTKGAFAEKATANIDKTFAVSKTVNELIEKHVPQVSDLNAIKGLDEVKSVAGALKNKLINADVLGFGPFVKQGHVMWFRHSDVTQKWSIHTFVELSTKKEAVATVEFGNSQDYAKDSIMILDAISENKASKRIADACEELSKELKTWFDSVEKTVEKESDQAKRAVLKHAREVMSTINANIHGITSVRELSKRSSDAIIQLLITDDAKTEADNKEKEKSDADKAKEEADKAKAEKKAAKAAKDGEKSTEGESKPA